MCFVCLMLYNRFYSCLRSVVFLCLCCQSVVVHVVVHQPTSKSCINIIIVIVAINMMCTAQLKV